MAGITFKCVLCGKEAEHTICAQCKAANFTVWRTMFMLLKQGCLEFVAPVVWLWRKVREKCL